MSDNNNGDVTDQKTQKDIEDKLSNKIDLYISDLGSEITSEYNKQEDLHSHHHLGQVLLALTSLKEGGCMLVKQYTFFSYFTSTLLYILSALFKNVFLSKPISSKRSNSETYLVCTDYIISDTNKEIINILRNRLNNFQLEPLFNIQKAHDWNKFIKTLTQASDKIFGTQIKYIDQAITSYEKVFSISRISSSHRELNNEKYKHSIPDLMGEKKILKDWNEHYHVKKLKDKFEINVRRY